MNQQLTYYCSGAHLTNLDRWRNNVSALRSTSWRNGQFDDSNTISTHRRSSVKPNQFWKFKAYDIIKIVDSTRLAGPEVILTEKLDGASDACKFVQQSRVDVRKYFFCNRVVKIWNSLPATTEDFDSIGMFKGLINRVDLSQYVNFWCMQLDARRCTD